jgi:hypothetical protein
MEFPEIAERQLDNIGKCGFNPTLAHIAKLANNPRIPKTSAGTGITARTERLAIEIIELMTRQTDIEGQLETLFDSRECKPYADVLRRFGFGTAMIATLLPRIYPIEKFLADGKIDRDKQRHDLSLRSFQAYLGLAYEYEKSGDSSAQSKKTKKKWHGSKPTRADFYAWLLSNPVKSKFKPKNDIQRFLMDSWIKPRKHTQTTMIKGVKKTEELTLPSLQSLGKDGICRFLFVLTRLLWKELRNELDMLDF